MTRERNYQKYVSKLSIASHSQRWQLSSLLCTQGTQQYCVYVHHQHTSTPQSMGHQPANILLWIIANSGLASWREWERLSGPLGGTPGAPLLAPGAKRSEVRQ